MQPAFCVVHLTYQPSAHQGIFPKKILKHVDKFPLIPQLSYQPGGPLQKLQNKAVWLFHHYPCKPNPDFKMGKEELWLCSETVTDSRKTASGHFQWSDRSPCSSASGLTDIFWSQIRGAQTMRQILIHNFLFGNPEKSQSRRTNTYYVKTERFGLGKLFQQ